MDHTTATKLRSETVVFVETLKTFHEGILHYFTEEAKGQHRTSKGRGLHACKWTLRESPPAGQVRIFGGVGKVLLPDWVTTGDNWSWKVTLLLPACQQHGNEIESASQDVCLRRSHKTSSTKCRRSLPCMQS